MSAASLFGLESSNISFCSSTSEAYNLLATAIAFEPGDNVVISDLEYPSGATPWLRIEGSPEIRIWRNRDGVLDPGELEKLVDEHTRVVQVSLVSFLTGFRIEWEPTRDAVRKRNPEALLTVDVTQAAGRVVLDCLDADCLFASSYKWLLGIHGASVVAVPSPAREKIVTRAGGWYHLANAFAEDRFARAESFPGAAGFAVGMPSFPSLYALKTGMDLVQDTGIAAIASHADPLVLHLHEGLADLGIHTMSPPQPGNCGGIVSFQHPEAEALHQFLAERDIYIMYQAGRLRVSIHGYNSEEDIGGLLQAMSEFLSR